MGKRIVAWFKWIAGVGVAIMAAFFLVRASQHRKGQVKLETKVQETQEKAGANIEVAKAERHKAKAAKLRAEAAVEEGRARIEKLKENQNEDLATRVEHFNRRLRRR